jgi:hypothetical protein
LRVAYRLQHNGSVWRFLALAALVPGCFYVDPINERPSAGIVRDDSGPRKRGDTVPVHVHAVTSDPDNDHVDVEWKVFACSVVDGAKDCDRSAFLDTTAGGIDIYVPSVRIELDAPPIDLLDVQLIATDAYGAVARPVQSLPVDIVNSGPTAIVQPADLSGPYPVTLPIVFFATKSDPDGPLSHVTLDWQLFPAPGSSSSARTWTKLDDDPMHPETEAYQLVPDVEGKWTVAVTPNDGELTGMVDDVDVQVAADQPPCLGATAPTIADGTTTLDKAQRFEVLSVRDDISGYPRPAPGSKTTTGFHWSMATPESGGAFVALGTDAPDVVLDPKFFKPGDHVDLRVEISDAIARTLPCDESKSSCAIDGGSSCFQRQTWHLSMGAP